MIERRNGVRKVKGEKRAMTKEEEVFFYLLAEIGRLCKTLPADHLRDRGRPAKTARGALVAPTHRPWSAHPYKCYSRLVRFAVITSSSFSSFSVFFACASWPTCLSS